MWSPLNTAYRDAPVAYTAAEPAFLATGRRVGTSFSHCCAQSPSLSNPAWRGRKKLLAPSARVPLCEQTRALERLLKRVFHFAFSGLGRMPVLKLEGKKKKLKKSASLPPRSIYFPLTNSDFIFLPIQDLFFFSLLNWAQANVAKDSLLMSLFVKHTITAPSPPFWEQALAFTGWLQPKGNFPTQLSPSPNALFFKIKISFSFFFKSITVYKKRV